MVSRRLLISLAPLCLGCVHFVYSINPIAISYARLTCQLQVTYLNSVVMPDPVNADEDSESD
jgi:hypothetical protein